VREGELDGETDTQGNPLIEEPMGLAVLSRPADWFPVGARPVAVGSGEPPLAEPLPLEPGELLAAALPAVPVVPEVGWVGVVSLVVGDGDVVVDGDGLVDVGVGVLLVLPGAELFELPGDGVTPVEGVLVGWHLLAAGEVDVGREKPVESLREWIGEEPFTAPWPPPPPVPPPWVVCPAEAVGAAVMRGMAMAAKAPAATTKIARPVAVTGRSQRRPGRAACPGGVSVGLNRSTRAQKISQAVPKAGTAQPASRTAATEPQPEIEENDSSGGRPSRSLIRSSPSADGSTDSAAACKARRRMSS
jgi:hypothetical protein